MRADKMLKRTQMPRIADVVIYHISKSLVHYFKVPIKFIYMFINEQTKKK